LGLAAERGHARAQLYFGLLREQGLGVQADLESARQWYRRAAAQGDADAYSRLRVLSDTQAAQQAQAAVPSPDALAYAHDDAGAMGQSKASASTSCGR
jgi:TPR repeat protein